MKEKKSIIPVLLLLILIGLVIYFGTAMLKQNQSIIDANNANSNNSSNLGGVGLTIDENAGEYVEPELKEEVSQGVAIPGWGSITIDADVKDVMVDFMNPEDNKDMYYLTFELRLAKENSDEYEVLYKSGLVEPGLHIQKISLSRPLSAGTYEAIVHVQPYKMDEAKTPTNNADMKTKLIVK